MKQEAKRARLQDILRAMSDNSDQQVTEDSVRRVSGGSSDMNAVVQKLLDSFSARIEPAGLILARARVGWKSDASVDEVAETLERLGLFDQPRLDPPAPENLPIVE